LKGINIDTAAPPLVAQALYLAVAKVSEGEDYLENSRIFEKASTKMKENAGTNKPNFGSVFQAISDAHLSGLESDLEIFLRTGGKESSILKAIRQGDLDFAVASLKDDLSLLNQEVSHGYGALHYAACYNRAAIIKLLVSYGISANQFSGARKESTPLALAARNGNVDCVRALLHCGAKVEPPFTGLGRVPIREAIIFSDDTEGYIATVRALLNAGASIDHGGYGTTPIHNAVHSPKIIEILIRHAPDSVDCLDMSRGTPLHHAVRRRCKATVEVLLALGANVNAPDENGFTPLHLACRTYDTKKMPYHSPELEDIIQSQAVGTQEDMLDIRRILREAGADIDAVLFGGMYGASLTPDSFLYDLQTDITEQSIPCSDLKTCSDSLQPGFCFGEPP
jgi:ankyrin repeat protein